ncbi:TonB-dependent receptor domain-containing protein [Phenylobacterium terrae]|uniref:TonB-dependent receptor domain-containing protein n=1 Tax=Phenylobacterium terrae TaxID=2665495 RepID=A0ABW4N132_9CAUL
MADDAGPPTEVDGVVVTAAGYEQQVVEAPASISVIAREDIQQMRASSLAEVLSSVEGVDVGGAVGKTGGLDISIRGMGSDYTLILIDGRRQNTAGSVTPNGFGETATSFLPPVSAIDRVEVVRGPMSTLYGSDAMGGVVNIITRRPSDRWTGTASVNGTLQGDREFGDMWGGDFYVTGPIADTPLGLALRGGYAKREASELTFGRADGSQAPVTGFGRSATEAEIWSLGGRLSLMAFEDHDLWIDVDVARQWYDNSAGQMGTNTTAGGYADALEFNRDQYLLAHNWRLPFGVLESTLSRGVTETVGRLIPPGVPGAGGPRELKSTNDIFDTKLFTSWGDHTLSLGGQYWDAEMIDGVAPETFEHVQWAVFAEDTWRLTEALSLTVGARHDDHSKFGSHFSPRAYLVWNATDAWTVKGGISKGFKTPRLEQLAEGINGFGRQGQLPLLGTPTLMPETSVSSELVVYYDAGGPLTAQATLFNNEFEDKIATGQPVANCTFGLTRAQYDAGGYPTSGCVDVGFWPTHATFGQSVNIDEAVTRGLEAAVRFEASEAWSLSANYTFTESEQKSGPAKGKPLTDTPRHMINGRVAWRPTERLTAWLSGEYRSERYRGEGAARDALGDYKAYELFHLGGSYQLTENVRLNAAVYNLFDKDFVRLLPYGTPVQYAPEYTNNQEPRRLWVGVNVEF